MSRFWAGLILFSVSASAQDVRSVSSPNGQIEFRAFQAVPAPGQWDRLAYQVLYKGKPVIDTSFIGFEIRDQNPLGEKLGLIGEKASKGGRYNSLFLDYLQNGTTGRRFTLEARAFDSGVAFRYIIPNSNPLAEIFIQNEDTEFRFPEDVETFPSLLPDFGEPAKPAGAMKLSQLSPDAIIATPFVAEESGGVWISISEAADKVYPRLYLNPEGDLTLETTLPPLPNDPKLALDTTTPLVCPWRMIAIGTSREAVSGAGPAIAEP
ncbi:MAG TPA: glycoside hydrolase family 97 N-terminal domain-containing protein [Bryobacteraceae bacterium]|nr:glycoside hydrolase family 97 N-terminal domain-containing protein [Bryobacteraceae bacterium]